MLRRSKSRTSFGTPSRRSSTSPAPVAIASRSQSWTFETERTSQGARAARSSSASSTIRCVVPLPPLPRRDTVADPKRRCISWSMRTMSRRTRRTTGSAARPALRPPRLYPFTLQTTQPRSRTSRRLRPLVLMRLRPVWDWCRSHRRRESGHPLLERSRARSLTRSAVSMSSKDLIHQLRS